MVVRIPVKHMMSVPTHFYLYECWHVLTMAGWVPE